MIFSLWLRQYLFLFPWIQNNGKYKQNSFIQRAKIVDETLYNVVIILFSSPFGRLLKAMPSYFWNFRETPCEDDLCHDHLLTNLNSKWITIDTAAFPSSIHYNNCHGKVSLNHHEQNISYTVLPRINWKWKRYYQQWRLKKKDFASPFVRARNVICGVTHTAWTEAIVDKNMPSKNFVMEHCTAKELSTRPSWRLFQTNCQQAIY